MFKKLLVACFALAAVWASAQPRDWVNRYSEISRMLERKDTVAFEALFDPSFVSIDPKGNRMNREAFFRMIDSTFKNTKKAFVKMAVKGVRETGGRVDVSFDMRLTLRQKNGGRILIHEVGVDSWKQFNHKWYIVKTVDSVLDWNETRPGRRKPQ